MIYFYIIYIYILHTYNIEINPKKHTNIKIPIPVVKPTTILYRSFGIHGYNTGIALAIGETILFCIIHL